jgi:hypothetical protein
MMRDVRNARWLAIHRNTQVAATYLRLQGYPLWFARNVLLFNQ